jgi:hypothetical protein
MDYFTGQAVLPETVLLREMTVRRADQRNGIPRVNAIGQRVNIARARTFRFLN